MLNCLHIWHVFSASLLLFRTGDLEGHCLLGITSWKYWQNDNDSWIYIIYWFDGFITSLIPWSYICLKSLFFYFSIYFLSVPDCLALKQSEHRQMDITYTHNLPPIYKAVFWNNVLQTSFHFSIFNVILNNCIMIKHNIG